METQASLSLAQKMWTSSLRIALIMYVLYFVIVALFYTVGITGETFAKAFAGTANLLLAMSLSLSAFGYYFNFLDKRVIYRKYFGLLGFFSALGYTLLLPVLNPNRYFYGFFENFWSSDFILGLASMAIFTGMAIISNNKAMLWLGPQRWRSFLRLGYVAYFLLVLRAIINRDAAIGVDYVGEMWGQWLMTFEGPIPLRLLFSLIASAVIFFRLSVEFDKRFGRKSTPLTPSIPAPSIPVQTSQNAPFSGQ